MLQRLTAGEPRFSIDPRELDRAGPSYTVDTLRALHAEQPGTRWWLVIGQDQYARFDTWHEWREILALAGLAVAARDDQPCAPRPAWPASPTRCASSRCRHSPIPPPRCARAPRPGWTSRRWSARR